MTLKLLYTTYRFYSVKNSLKCYNVKREEINSKSGGNSQWLMIDRGPTLRPQYSFAPEIDLLESALPLALTKGSTNFIILATSGFEPFEPKP